MVAAQSDAARWLQSRVRQRGGRSVVVAAQSDTARWLERGIINVQILRHSMRRSHGPDDDTERNLCTPSGRSNEGKACEKTETLTTCSNFANSVVPTSTLHV